MKAPRRLRNLGSLLTLSLLLGGFSACKTQQAIEKGKLIKLHYTLKVDGNVVDSSDKKPPLSFVQGSGQIIPGLEEQLVGLKAGDKKHVTLAPEKGYGTIDPKAQQVLPTKAFGDVTKLKVGMMVTGQNGNRPVQAKVVKIGAKDVTLDFNHPLAGKILDFDIEVVEVSKAPTPSNPSAPDVPPAEPTR